MSWKRSHMTGRILDLTLEIIYLLTGEVYVPEPKLVRHATPNSFDRVSGEWCKSHSPIRVPSPPSLISERNNDKKILEVTQKMIELLTGEVPIRCQDVTVYFSMEEWEYVEGHKELYKDVMMASQPALTSPDGSSNGNPPERCPRPLYSRDSTQEDLTIPHHHQNGVLVDIKVEVKEEAEPYVRDDDPRKEEEVVPEIRTADGQNSQNYTEDRLAFNFAEKASFDLGENQRALTFSECGTGFSNQALLLAHRRSHAGEKPYACPFCWKCFEHKSDVNRHQRIHTAEKPFSCSQCGKRFTQKSNHMRHQKVHLGEKPYSCSHCGKHFTQKAHLLQHQTVHSGQKPYCCTICGKYFAHQSSFSRHLRNHTGDKPYACRECGDRFTQSSSLARHRQRHLRLLH